jgi:integral membrane protein
MDSVKSFRIIALAEATSFIALLVATAVKHGAGNEIGVEILGPIHGALFLAYAVGAVFMKSILGWNILTTLAVLAGAVLPFGGYVVDYWMTHKMRTSNDPARAATPE